MDHKMNMIIWFVISLLLLGFCVYVWNYIFTSGDNISLKDFFEDKTSTIITICLVSLTLFSIWWVHYTYVTPGSDIHHEKMINDYTMEVTEYSISGDSIILHNIKRTINHCGVITNVKEEGRWMGKIYQTHYIVTVKLNDGRTVTEDLTNNPRVQVNNGIKVTEKFYPSYSIKINF